jgi:2-iminobutanoate/2-iminopropanoate deaminase
MAKKIIVSEKAPAPIGPYSQAVKANGMLFISGQIAINPETNELVINTLIGETHQVMKNLQAILEASDMSFENVVKTTILLSDMEMFGPVNEIYALYFTGDFPARETYAVKALPKNVHLEISMIAVEK